MCGRPGLLPKKCLLTSSRRLAPNPCSFLKVVAEARALISTTRGRGV